MYIRLIVTALLAMLGLVLSGCGTTHATYRDAANLDIMLLGFDPVSYFTGAAPLKGQSNLAATHEGRTYHFSSTSNREIFVANASRFEPQFGGFCSNGAAYGMKWASNPTSFEIVDDRLFIFSGEGSKSSWALDKKANIAFGDGLWKSEMEATGWRWQSIKRMIFRVGHYKDTEELNARWQKQFPGQLKPAPQNGGIWPNLTNPPVWQAATGLGQEAIGWP